MVQAWEHFLEELNMTHIRLREGLNELIRDINENVGLYCKYTLLYFVHT